MREVDEGVCVQALRAAAQMVPFLTWRGDDGTDIPALNPHVKVVDDPFGTGPVLAVEALPVDVAGSAMSTAAMPTATCQPVGTGYTDRLHKARPPRARSCRSSRRSPTRRCGARPGTRRCRTSTTSCARRSARTRMQARGATSRTCRTLQEYVAAAKAGGAAIDEYLDRYVRSCADRWGALRPHRAAAPLRPGGVPVSRGYTTDELIACFVSRPRAERGLGVRRRRAARPARGHAARSRRARAEPPHADLDDDDESARGRRGRRVRVHDGLARCPAGPSTTASSKTSSRACGGSPNGTASTSERSRSTRSATRT